MKSIQNGFAAILSVVTFGCLFAGGSAFAQSVGSIQMGSKQASPKQPGPTWQAMTVDELADSQVMAFPTPLKSQFDSLGQAGKGAPLAIGFPRYAEASDLADGVMKLTRKKRADAETASIAILSPSAKALRVGLQLEGLPAKAKISVRGSDEFERVIDAGDVGSLRALAQDSGVYWTPVTAGERQYIEILLPKNTDPVANAIKVQAVSHIAVSPAELVNPAAVAAKVGESGSCNVNVVCQTGTDPALATIASAVARMVFVEAGSSFLCTGTLINDVSGSFTPNFYTANHCIDTQAVASTLNTFFFYDAPTCPNGVTVGAFVQLTGGANFLYGASNLDATLLRLNNPAPAGAMLVGWDAAILSSNLLITGVHHPSGDVKKVSRGSSKGLCGTSSLFNCVGWTVGTTEGGSSGSGLFTAVPGDYRLRGGLFGGSASCANTGNVNNAGNNDEYSRFDLVYPNIQQFLSAASAPINDNFANRIAVVGAPHTLVANSTSATNEAGEPNHVGISGGKSLWWSWQTSSSLPVTISTAGSNFDTLLAVYTGTSVSALSFIAANDDSVGLTSAVTFTPVPGTIYQIAVDGFGGEGGAVALGISQSAVNDHFANRTLVTAVPTTISTSNFGASKETGEPLHAGNAGGRSLWWRWVATNASPITITTLGSNFDTTLAVYTGTVVNGLTPVVSNDDSAAGGLTSAVTFTPTSGQTYQIAVDGYNGQIGNIALNFSQAATVIAAAPNDFNGDLKSDLLFRDTTTGEVQARLMNGSTTLASASLVGAGAWTVTHTADFNNDSRADLLWRNVNGTTILWLMNGTTAVNSAVLLNADPSWSVTHLADFNGDGKADILWRNTDGRVIVWLMDGTAAAASVVLLGATPDWRVTHVGDFNGDGKADILWRHTNGTTIQWLMNGTASTANTVLLGADPDWRVTHVGDFNNDGKADILWRHSNGTVIQWLMNGGTITTNTGLLAADIDWRVSHVGDFNGDGRADLLWRHTNGAVAQWLMSGATFTASAALLGPDPAWRVSHIADYNGDGKSDILWRNTADGSIIMWLMNGATPTPAGILGPSPWVVVP